MECPEALDVMGEAIDGSLKGAVLAGFQEHIGECASCGAYFDQLRITRATLATLPPGPTSPRRAELLDLFRKELGKPPPRG